MIRLSLRSDTWRVDAATNEREVLGRVPGNDDDAIAEVLLDVISLADYILSDPFYVLAKVMVGLYETDPREHAAALSDAALAVTRAMNRPR